MLEILACLATVTGLFFWNRTESRADIRWIAEINRTNREELKEEIRAAREESKEATRRIEGLVDAIHQEMKDFHGRLCAIDERTKKPSVE
jgi:hypothetical protein